MSITIPLFALVFGGGEPFRPCGAAEGFDIIGYEK